MDELVSIAESLKVALAALSPLAGLAFSAERCFVPPDYDSAATNDLKLFVIGFEEDVDLNGPNGVHDECEHKYGVKIAIAKRIKSGSVTSPQALVELDELSSFRKRVIEFVKAKENRVQGEGTLSALKNSPATYDPATLNEKKVYVSVIDATYRTIE